MDTVKKIGNPIVKNYHNKLFFKAFKTKSKQLNLIKKMIMALNIMIYMIHVSQKKN
jgi:hypothetical protein